MLFVVSRCTFFVVGARIHMAIKNHSDGQIQAVAQQEVAHVEGIPVVFHPLGKCLGDGEFGHAQQVDEVVLVVEGGVAAVLHVLEILGQLHLGVKQPVLVDVLLVLDLLSVGQLGHRLLVGLLQLVHGGLILLLGQHLFLGAADQHWLVVGVVIGLEIVFRVGDELGDLVLVLGLHRLGLLQLLHRAVIHRVAHDHKVGGGHVELVLELVLETMEGISWGTASSSL